MTGTILDAHDKQNPTPWWHWKKPSPTALQLATAALEECRRDALEHKGKQEYHAAMAEMLKKRDARLVADIARLSQPQEQP